MKRRNIILMTAAGAVAIAIPSGCNFHDDSNTRDLPEGLELLSDIWDDRTLIEVGYIYLKKFPDENAAGKLNEFLMQGHSPETGKSEFFQEKIRDDFASENIVMLDGWFLSLTEARLCALFSLKQNIQ